MDTVNRLVISFRNRLLACTKLGGKTIVPYIRNRKINYPDKINSEKPPLTFNPDIDKLLIQYQGQSYKKTGEILELDKNLIKYRTNFLLNKKRNDETEKNKIHNPFQAFYPIPQISQTDQLLDNLEEDLALDKFPIITYVDDGEEEDSSYDYSENN